MWKAILFLVVGFADAPPGTAMVVFPIKFEDAAACVAWAGEGDNIDMSQVHAAMRPHGGKILRAVVECMEIPEERGA